MDQSLIIGAASGLAQTLATNLQASGYEIDGVVRNSAPAECNLFRKICVGLDQADHNYDVVFLVGCYIPERMNAPDYYRLFRDNVALVHGVVQRFQHCKIVFISSVAVMGASLSEVDSPDDYAVSKAVGEDIIRLAPEWAVVRLSSIYGSGIRRPNFISRAVSQALELGEITLYGMGNRRQDYLNYRDAAEMIRRAGESTQGGDYLGVFGRSYSNLEIAELVQAGVPGTTIRVIDRPEGESNSYPSMESWERLGIQPEITPEQGIGELIEEWQNLKA